MSDTRSTGNSYRVSRGKHVLGCVDVPIVGSAACLALPLANAERKRFYDRATRVAGLAARKESVDLHEVAPVPFALVSEHGQQLTPAGIADDASKRAIVNHSRNVQIFDCYHLVFANESSAELVQ